RPRIAACTSKSAMEFDCRPWRCDLFKIATDLEVPQKRSPSALTCEWPSRRGRGHEKGGTHMNNSTSRTTLIIGAAVVAGGMVATTAEAQSQAPAAPGAPAAAPATPRDADGHPILAGLWTGGANGVTATTAGNVTQ